MGGAARLRHQALLYEGRDDFVGALGAFLRDGLEEEAQVVAISAPARLGWLREELGADAARMSFVDAAEIPARAGAAFRALRDRVRGHAGSGRGRVRIVSERDLTGVDGLEVDAYMRHEAAANVVLEPFDARLVCPFDVTRLPGGVADDARCTHPEVADRNGVRASGRYADPRAFVRPRADAGTVPGDARVQPLEAPSDLARVRAAVRATALVGGLAADAAGDLVVAASEIASNALRHGRPPRALWTFVEEGRVVCLVRDAGPGPPDPLAGYLPPQVGRGGGRGLWLAHQLCDAVDLAAGADGTYVRLVRLLPRTSTFV